LSEPIGIPEVGSEKPKRGNRLRTSSAAGKVPVQMPSRPFPAHRLAAVASAALCVACATLSEARARIRSSVVVTVESPKGALDPLAVVLAYSESGGEPIFSIDDDAGRYRFSLADGKYRFEATRHGCTTATAEFTVGGPEPEPRLHLEPDAAGQCPGDTGMHLATPAERAAPREAQTQPPSSAPPDPDQVGPIRLERPGRPIAYSSEAIRRNAHGFLVVRCTIDKLGEVHSCKVLQGVPYQTEMVVRSLESRLYEPITVGGVPADIDYTFKLTLGLIR
jgi:hypothetical protein